MNLTPGTQRITSETSVGGSGKPVRVYAVCVMCGAASSNLIMRNGVSTSDTEQWRITGSANIAKSESYFNGIKFENGCFISTDTNLTYATISYTNEF
jgi:hypothetical protein